MIPSHPNILVVDDELFFRKLYCDLLQEEGYRVDVCENGEEAMAVMRRKPVDLVLTDMVMPGCSGLDVLQYARTLANAPDVILVTGHASLESAIDALKNGARDYLIKPFNSDELKHTVRRCLEQRKLLAENDHLRRQIQLFQTGQSLSALIDLERLIPQSLENLMRETGAVQGCAFVLKGGLTPCLAGSRGMTTDAAEALIDDLLTAFEAAADLKKAQTGIESALVRIERPPEPLWILPLSDNEVLKGGIVLGGMSLHEQNPEAMSDLRYLCDQVLLGFENACRYQNAQELMYTDDLTGLYNHRYMQVVLAQEIKRSQRYGLNFSLLFLDLDRFKEINDQYGHLAGSAALQEVGQLLRRCVRDVDSLFRFGGDEFAAILVETDEKTARIVAERIRRAIEKHAFLERQGTPSYVTVSAGFSTFPSDATAKERLLDLADQAMYVGKATRNMICSVKDIAKSS